MVRERGKNVTCYSGWTYGQLLAKHDPAVDALLAQTDVLIDGPFLLAERDLTLRFRGSRNQRVIDMNKTRETGKVVLLNVDEP
jgi:anaerobic ribonucleoside-triphosphate reductase activating protein